MLRSVVKAIPVVLSLPCLCMLAPLQSVAAQVVRTSASPAPVAFAPPIVGVVDVNRAIEQYPRYIKLSNELQQRVDAMQNQLKVLAQELDELRGTIQVLAIDTEERAEKEFMLQMGLQRQDFMRKSFRSRMRLDSLRNTLMVFEDLEIAIGKVAATRGVTLVLSKHDIEPAVEPIAKLSGREVEVRVNSYERRQVWFASETLDMTGDVIKFLMVPLAEKPDAVESGAPKSGAGKPGAVTPGAVEPGVGAGKQGSGNKSAAKNGGQPPREGA